MSTRFVSLSLRRMMVLFVVVFGVGLLVVAGGASALTYVSKGTFCEPGGIGTPPCSPEIGHPIALTVDPVSGDLLMVDQEAKTIRRFKPDGTPDDFGALATNTIDGKRSGAVNECPTVPADCDETPQNELVFAGSITKVQVAIAPAGSAGGTAGDIYVAQSPSHLVNVFAPSGKYLGQLTQFKEGADASGAVKALGEAAGVSVDPAGTVYVSDHNDNEIHRYVPTGNPVTSSDSTANFSYPHPGLQLAGAGASAGFLFAADFDTGVVGRLNALSGVEECEVSPGVNLLALNLETGHPFVANEIEIKEYDGGCPAKLLGSLTPGGNIRGIAVDGARGLVYLSKEGMHTIEVWEPVVAPEVKSLPAGPVGHESAVLSGEVNPQGLPLSKCVFELGQTVSYGVEVPCAEYEEGGVWHKLGSPGDLSGSALVPVRAEVKGLAPGSAYHFRLAVANANTAVDVDGGDGSFVTTGPGLFGEGVVEAAATSAMITAGIDPNGEDTGFVVQYLTEAAFQANSPGERFAGAQQAPVSGEREVPVTITGIGNLKAGSHFVTEAGTSAGAFGSGERISGPGIPAGTTIESLQSPSELKLSKPASETKKGVALTATGPRPVSQLLSGLSPNTAYRFRFRATNAGGVTTGAGAKFTTDALPGELQAEEVGCANVSLRQGFAALLPDCRAYEMVSPPTKLGEVIAPEPLGGTCPSLGCLPGSGERMRPMQSAPDGGSVVYSGQPFSAGLSGGQNTYLSGRGGPGWSLDALNPLAAVGTWEAFSEDLSRGVFVQSGIALAPSAPTRGGKAFANLYLRDAAGALTPLITEEPPNRSPGGPGELKVRYAAANAGTATSEAFTHIAFEANDALTGPAVHAPAAPPLTAGGQCLGSPCDLYEWSGGQLSLVNVAPGNGAALGRAAIGGGRLLERSAGHEVPALDNAISADGSRVFWSSEETGHVYVRVNGLETLEVPGPGTCEASEPSASRACFLTASAEGAEVLLSNGQLFGLNGAGSAYVLRGDLTEGEGGFEGYLASGEEEGRVARVYFADPKILPGAAANVAGEKAKELVGRVNLYYWHAGTTSFIASLPGTDNVGEFFGDWRAPRADRTAQATGDGRYLTFMSTASLSGYDNSCRQLNGAREKCSEVFEYAAETGVLGCPSCNPSGQPPLGPSNLARLSVVASAPDFRQPNNLPPTGNGRLFFESQDSLVSQDTNGHIQDVYEWEPGGVGGCAEPAGCVRLISSGSSPNDSMFMDASATGDDAFFITRQQLLSRDKDGQLDLYDARVGGGLGEEAPGVCSGEGCRGSLVSAPVSLVTGSILFNGPGNVAFSAPPVSPSSSSVVGSRGLTRAQKFARALRVCAEQPRRKRGSCRARAMRRYGPTKARAGRSRVQANQRRGK
jgi:hypothetical protein